MSESLGLVNSSAEQLWQKSLLPSDRVLITGASGWFGQTATYLMQGLPQEVLLTASSSRTVQTAAGNLSVVAWDESMVNDFGPTVVIDCAFLTRDLVTDEGLADYVRANEQLTANLIHLAHSDSVRRLVTISSGAAMYPEDALLSSIENNPYGYLKRQAELELQQAVQESNKQAVVARAWAVSGAFIGKPQNYALADMILQALRGSIDVKADKRVERRYSAVEDLLALSLAKSQTDTFSVIDSEGPLIEMGELAQRVADLINPIATLSRPQLTNQPANDYWSRTETWPSLCERFGLIPADLDHQIMRTLNGLKSSGLA